MVQIQARSWRRRAAGQPAARSTSSTPRGTQGWWGVLDTEPESGTEELLALVAPAAPDYYESLRPPRVDSGYFAVARCSVNDNEVEAATVVGVNTFRTDRLASDLNPRPFNDETRLGSRPVRGQATWWSPYASQPQPHSRVGLLMSSAPQCAAVRGKGSRRRRIIATCIGARVDDASKSVEGIAANDIPACRPD